MNDSTLKPESAECAVIETAVQSYLDGDGIDLATDTRAHCANCPICRGNVRAAVEMRRILQLAPPPVVPIDLASRVVSLVLTDRTTPRRHPFRSRRPWLWATVAASLLISSGLIATRFWPTPVASPQPPGPGVAHVRPVEPQPLREQLADAGSAMASLTRRTADRAVEPTRKLVADRIDEMSLDVVGQIPKAMDPAVQSLQQVRQGAASGLEPVAHSARRAWSMFLDMPPLDRDRKPDY